MALFGASIGKVTVDAELNSAPLTAGLTKAKGSVTSFGTAANKQVAGLKTMALGGLGAAAAVTALGSALVDASKAAMEDEKSQALLANAMRNNLDATDEQVASMEAWIDKTARAVGVADDELRPALQNLIIAGMDAETSQKNLGLALDIAAAKGLSVEAVTKALGKAYQGNVGGLGRLGIATKDVDGDMLSFEAAMAKAAETMGGSATVAAATLEGQMRRAKVAVDEAKESVGGWVNVQLASAITAVTFLNASMDQANKGNELFVLGMQQVAAQTEVVVSAVDTLEGGLVVAAEHAVTPTTAAFMEQVTALNLTEGETRELITGIDDLAARELIGRDDANRLTGALDNQAGQMATTREDGRLLGERYHLLGDDAETARVKAAGYRRELARQGDEMRKLTDPVFALRDAQRQYNDAFETWSTLMIDSQTPAAELQAAEDDLTEAGLDLADAEREAAAGGREAKDAWNEARGAVGLLEDATWGSKEAIDQWSQAVNNAPRWHPGTGTSGGETPQQHGGPVSAGQLLRVGEQGEELFVPGVSGWIVPHRQTEQILAALGHAGGAGTPVAVPTSSSPAGMSVVVNSPMIGDPAQVARLVGREVAWQATMSRYR